MIVSSTNMLGMPVFDTFLAHPVADFEIADDLCSGAFRDIHRVTYMIAVTMGN
jgi:hypothetical protein